MGFEDDGDDFNVAYLCNGTDGREARPARWRMAEWGIPCGRRKRGIVAVVIVRVQVGGIQYIN